MPEALFPPGTTHVNVRCWKCGHVRTLLPGDLPENISLDEFERKAKCSKCGSTWPHVTQLPKKPGRWG